MSKMTAAFVSCAIVWLCIPHGEASADQCEDVLRWGAQEQFKSVKSMDANETFHYILCAKSRSSGTRSGGFQFNIPIPQLKGIVGIGQQDQNAHEKRQEFCKRRDAVATQSQREEVFKVVVNPTALEKWERCMRSKRIGLSCEIKQSGPPRTFLVSVKWETDIKAEDPRVRDEPILVGATCAGIPAKDDILEDKVSTTFRCDKSGAESAAVVLNTTQGSLTCELPKDPPQPVPGKELLQCSEGLEAACQMLEENAHRDYAACTQKVRAMPDKTPLEQQAKAVSERACGNQWVNYNSNLALIQHVREVCDSQGAQSAACISAQDALKRNMAAPPPAMR